MLIPENTTTAAAAILDVIIQMPQPFTEGHVCTASESKVLNQVFKENIANNTRAKIKAILAENDGDTEASVEASQTVVDEYIASYEFGVRVGGEATLKATPLERRMHKLATAMLRTAFKQQGYTATPEQLAEKVVAMLEHPEISETLRANAEAELEAERASAKNVFNIAGLFVKSSIETEAPVAETETAAE